MVKRTRPTVGPPTPIGPDADLERDDVRLPDGTRRTEPRAAAIADGVRRRAGRPSLTGDAVASPRISFRITPSVRDQAAEVAAREGKTISQLAREAFEARVAAPEPRS